MTTTLTTAERIRRFRNALASRALAKAQAHLIDHKLTGRRWPLACSLAWDWAREKLRPVDRAATEGGH